MKKILSMVLSVAVLMTTISMPFKLQKIWAEDDLNETGNPIGSDYRWDLVWSDEFDGTSLNMDIWSYDTGVGGTDSGMGTGDGWGNKEVQYYTDRPDNVKVEDRYLKITAKEENYETKKYTSGRIHTKRKKSVQYGRIEAKIKVENGNQDSIWPAFWMMGANKVDGVIQDAVTWPQCGEIDIMEHANSNNYVEGCLHWNTDGLMGVYTPEHYGSKDEEAYGVFKDNENNGINGWHTYGLIWDKDHMEWQLDGQTYLSLPIDEKNAYCFQKEQFILLNLAVGGALTEFTGFKPVPKDFQTATMYVDWVRVYAEPNTPKEDVTESEQATSKEDLTESEQVTQKEDLTESEQVTTQLPEATTPLERNVVQSNSMEIKRNEISKVKITKFVAKKKSAKKVVVTVRAIKKAQGYQFYFYKTKTNAKNGTKVLVKKTIMNNRAKYTVTHKKLRNKKNLFVRIRALMKTKRKTIYGVWSDIKKIKVEK